MSTEGNVLVVTPPAEIDVLNSGKLRDALLSALADHATVVVDMTANKFCDSSGLQALVAAHRCRPGELRVAVCVVVPYRTLHRFCVERCGFARPRRRSGSPTGSPGWSASWTSGTCACWPTR